ncbi:hypothetical protein P0D73_41895 [Paraburkholderia sp. RL18-101-BIB-B]|uniref:hypothetical protein n=1 Tax=Paraburkholderia sp. RL18-101-BIB-B TaxID=3031634 RepID=UPI0038B87866
MDDAVRTATAGVQAMSIRRSDQIEFMMFASLPSDQALYTYEAWYLERSSFLEGGEVISLPGVEHSL